MMDKEKAPGNNEMCLFHGVKGSDCNDINRFGLFCHKESEYIRLIAAFCMYFYSFIYPVRCLYHEVTWKTTPRERGYTSGLVVNACFANSQVSSFPCSALRLIIAL